MRWLKPILKAKIIFLIFLHFIPNLGYCTPDNNNTCATATSVALPAVFPDTLNLNDDINDYVRFNIPSYGVLDISLSTRFLTSCGLTWTLYNEDCSDEKQSDSISANDDRVWFDIPISPGLYTLVFTHDGSTTSGDCGYLYEIEFEDVPTDPYFVDQWPLHNTGQGGGIPGEDINIISVWDKYTGNHTSSDHALNQIIAIVDQEGVEINHEDLADNVLPAYCWDWSDNDADPTPPSDLDYPISFHHGTMCAGVAVGKGWNNLGIRGVAPDAGLIGFRLPESLVADTLPQVAEILIRHNQIIDIYNNSWNYRTDSSETLCLLDEEIEFALERGAIEGRGGLGSIFVWSGGNSKKRGDNSNYNGYTNSRFTIAVAASTNTGEQADYSEPGANILINAPSSKYNAPPDNCTTINVPTVDGTGEFGDNPPDNLSFDCPDNYTGPGGVNYTKYFGGTSAAAPIASGVIALMIEANSELTWRDVQHILISTADKNDPSDSDWVVNGAGFHVNHKYGFGRINAQHAVDAAETWVSAGPELSIQKNSSPQLSIPDNSGTGITDLIQIEDQISVEFVEIEFTSDHPKWGDLEISIVSPMGTTSVLAAQHESSVSETAENWAFRFGSVRHFKELSRGAWRIEVKDKNSGYSGSLVHWGIKLFGTVKPPIFVDKEAQGLNDGSSWANAFDDINSAMTASQSGDQVWVKQGHYVLSQPINIEKDVSLYGGFSGIETRLSQRNPDVYATVIDGNNETRCFVLSANALVNGVTVQSGGAYPPSQGGGGFYIESSSPIIENCIILNNVGYGYGGGFYVVNSAPIIQNCFIQNNNTFGSSECAGGGIYNQYSDSIIRDCIFENNRAATAFGNRGGAIFNDASSPSIDNCRFTDNHASGESGTGGAVCNASGSHPIIKACQFIDNSAGGLSGTGGAIANLSSTPTIFNCAFEENTAGGQNFGAGGAVFSSNSSLEMINCTFFKNVASSGLEGESRGGAISNQTSTIQLKNSILWENDAVDGSDIFDSSDSTSILMYCDVSQNGFDGQNGNISHDPCFGANLHLRVDSPCRDAGDPASTPPNFPKTDIDGESRPQNYRYDIGSDEYWDTDSDNLPDYWELKWFGNLATDGVDHSDGDTLTNLDEFKYGTNPLVEDSDNDGVNDDQELALGSDPNDTNICPQIAGVLFVDGTNGSDSNRGLSASAAFSTIQNAISVANGTIVIPVTIRVAAGTYHETIEMNPWESIEGGWNSDFSQRWNFEQNGLTPSLAFETVIDGDASGRCISVIDAENAVISGFTVQNGNMPSGAGVFIDSDDVAISDCIFRNNTASSEGGAIDDDGSSIIRNCRFEGNTSRLGGALSTGDGTFIEQCIFEGNEAEFGGGIFGDHLDYTLTESEFVQNVAYRGGGIFNVEASPRIETCTFRANSFKADFTDTYVGGGGILNESASPQIINCTFVNNSAGLFGGGLYNYSGSSPVVENCIFWSNSAASSGDQILNDGSSATISFCDIQGSGGSGVDWDGSFGYDAGGNIDADPLFVNPLGNDGQPGTKDDNLHLSHASPCVNSGASEGTVFDDMGAFPAVTVGSTNDYETVAQALGYIESFSQGGSILIDSGDHLTDRLTIEGAPVSIIGADQSTTSVYSDGIGGINVVDSGCHLENLKLRYGTRIDNSQAIIRNCIIDTDDVGVFFLGNNSTSSGTVHNCILTNNQDAIRIYRSSNPITIVNNTISYNTLDGIYLMDTAADPIVAPVITNNIISNNGGYGIYEDHWNVVSLDAEITFNDFFGNTSGNYHDHTEQIYNSADDINTLTENGSCSVHSNIVTDPLFTGGDPMDFHLLEASPCIDTGDPFSEYSLEPEPNGGRINMGAYGGTAEATTTILDADQDGLSDDYENSVPCLDPNDADTDEDGILDGNEDIDSDGIVGPNESDPCLADTDGDGIYDGTEVGLTEPQNPAATDLSQGYFVADADPSSTTNPNSKDSDGDGIPDGREDLNRNGGIDACEPDPIEYTTNLLVDMDSDGDVDGADLAAYAQAISEGSMDLCVEFFSTYMGQATWLPDPDGDGILSDGDYSGIVGDYPCPDSIKMDCDDNCPYTHNAGQEDSDGNGVGDVCEYPIIPVFTPSVSNPLISDCRIYGMTEVQQYAPDEYRAFVLKMNTACNYPDDFNVDLFTSPDGIIWTETKSGILNNTITGCTFNYYITELKEDGVYKAWHAATSNSCISYDTVFYSESVDGMNYVNLQTAFGITEDYEERKIGRTKIVNADGTYYMYYRPYIGPACSGYSPSGVTVATSTDGKDNWTKHGIILSSDYNELKVIYSNGFFEGFTTKKIGDYWVPVYLTSLDGINWEEIGTIDSIENNIYISGIVREGDQYKLWYYKGADTSFNLTTGSK